MRLLALGLAALWAATAVAVAAAYRPGGPFDLVVIAICFAPVAIALVGVRWPATTRTPRHRAALVWLWILALLLAVPVLYGVGSTLLAAGPRYLVPSAEAAYSGGLALLAMSFSSLIGFVHEQLRVTAFERQASLLGGALAVVLTAVVGALFGLVVLVNEASVLGEEAPGSRFGPVGADPEPPLCDAALALGPNAAVTIEARSILDDEPRGTAVLSGQRRGRDESWSGSWSGPEGRGQVSYLRLGQEAWLRDIGAEASPAGIGAEASPAGAWRAVIPDPFDLGGAESLTLDGPAVAIADVPRGEIVAEDLGLEVVEGATARHCRTFMDGPTALATFLPLRWLLHDSSASADDRVRRWRGEMDWWVFTDGELGRARVEVSGSRADTDWDATGVRAVLEAELEAVDRDRVPQIAAVQLSAVGPTNVGSMAAQGPQATQGPPASQGSPTLPATSAAALESPAP
jgi:hypothetical protein